jgi:hypothetical protein
MRETGALPPPPAISQPSLEVKRGPVVPPPTPKSKAPLVGVLVVLVLAGAGFAAFHFRGQLLGDGAKKTEEGALKIEAPSKGSDKGDDTSPPPTASTRPPPQLASGIPQAQPVPQPHPGALPTPTPKPSTKPAPPPASTGKFDPQGI